MMRVNLKKDVKVDGKTFYKNTEGTLIALTRNATEDNEYYYIVDFGEVRVRLRKSCFD